ncbi:MAG: hypothetical protein PHR28_01495 [candidate division Zixibacteria bacterium]|nr:hypothetical protein [candidate division Zixibacteria bacterium]
MEKYKKDLKAIGAEYVNMPPGDYGWFILRADSTYGLIITRDVRGPVMFFSYFGPEEIISWTVRNIARNMRKPWNPEVWVDVYSGPPVTPQTIRSGITEPIHEQWPEDREQEMDTVLPRSIPRIYHGNIWEDRHKGLFNVGVYMEGVMPANAIQIRCRVRQTDDGIMVHLTSVLPRYMSPGAAKSLESTPSYMVGEKIVDPAQPRFRRLGGGCSFSPSSDTFNLIFINLADTARFRVMIDSSTVKITRQDVKLVIFGRNQFLRDPVDMFWVKVPNPSAIQLHQEWVRQIMANCAKAGAKLVLMPPGLYSTSDGIKRVTKDSINTVVDERGESRILFYRYLGPKEPIISAVDVDKREAYTRRAEFPLYFGPKSRKTPANDTDPPVESQ